VIDCPLNHIDEQTSELMKYAGYVRKLQTFPVAGGALDQTEAFMAACSMIESDTSIWRAHFGLKP